jgi:hypothetical protein
MAMADLGGGRVSTPNESGMGHMWRGNPVSTWPKRSGCPSDFFLSAENLGAGLIAGTMPGAVQCGAVHMPYGRSYVLATPTGLTVINT